MNQSTLDCRVPCGTGGPIIMSFALYLLGFIILISGVVYGARLMHVPSHWIVVLVLFMAGLAIIKGVKATRPKDSA